MGIFVINKERIAFEVYHLQNPRIWLILEYLNNFVVRLSVYIARTSVLSLNK